MKDIEIEWYCGKNPAADGWAVKVDGKRFTWDYNDDDMGTIGLKALLKYLGHKVHIKEVY